MGNDTCNGYSYQLSAHSRSGKYKYVRNHVTSREHGRARKKDLTFSSNTTKIKFGKTQVYNHCLKYSPYSLISIREYPEYFF